MSKYYDKTHRQMDCAKIGCPEIGDKLKMIGGQIRWLCEAHFRELEANA